MQRSDVDLLGEVERTVEVHDPQPVASEPFELLDHPGRGGAVGHDHDLVARVRRALHQTAHAVDHEGLLLEVDRA